MGDLRRVRGEATRQALIRAAVDSVARHGLSGTTLSTVAAFAGMSRASVGFHFLGKEQLLAAALDHGLGVYDASLKQALASAAPGAASRLAAIVCHDVKFPVRFPSLLSMWFAVWGEAQTLSLYRAGTLPHDRRYQAELADIVLAVSRDAAVAARFTTVLTTMTFGMWLDHHLDPEGYDLAGNLAAAQGLVDDLSGGRSGGAATGCA